MITQAEREKFETRAYAGADLGALRALAASLSSSGGPYALRAFAGLALHAAAAAPERLAFVYDTAVEGWLGAPVAVPPVEIEPAPLAPIGPDVWDTFWGMVEDPELGAARERLLERAETLTGLLAPGMIARVAKAALAYPGAREAAARGFPARFTRERLARCPAGSLGASFHALAVREKIDLGILGLEVDAVRSPAPLSFFDARIAQGHELWRLTAGYERTRLHELALAAFQAAQFGRLASALALACVLTKIAFTAPAGANVALDMILTGWKHGRETPPLIGLDWEAVWDQPVEAVRAELGVAAFVTPWPADLFEQYDVGLNLP